MRNQVNIESPPSADSFISATQLHKYCKLLLSSYLHHSYAEFKLSGLSSSYVNGNVSTTERKIMKQIS